MSGSYLIRRGLQIVPTLAGILLVSFILLHAAPGDPLVAIAGELGDEEYFAFMRSKFGLDRPLPEQLATYVGNVLRGDLGVSYVHGRPVVHVILERLPASLLLMLTSLFLSSTIGISLGVLAARRPFTRVDLGINLASLAGHALPFFLLSQITLLTLGFYAGLFPDRKSVV